jgi:hypothetical protein
VRQVLEYSGDLSEATDTLLGSSRLCGANVILGDAKAPKAIVIEACAHRYQVFEPIAGRDFLARSNHFISPELAQTQRGVLYVKERLGSETRLAQLLSLLEYNGGRIGVNTGTGFLPEGDLCSSTAPSQIARADESPSELQCALFDPTRLTMRVRTKATEDSPAAYVDLDLRSALLDQR